MNIENFLSKTVMLIDTNFLNEQINLTLNFYKNLYPNKIFEKIQLDNLLYNFARYVDFREADRNVAVIFAYGIDQSGLLSHCEPNNLLDFIDIHQVQMQTDLCRFNIRSYFGAEDETCCEHFVHLLKEVMYKRMVSRIIVIADCYELNYELRMMNEEDKEKIILFRKRDTEITVVPISYGYIDYPLARALGLKGGEI